MLVGLPAPSAKFSLSPPKLEENAPDVPTKGLSVPWMRIFFPCPGTAGSRVCKTPCQKHGARAGRPSQRGVKAGSPEGTCFFQLPQGERGGEDVCDRGPGSPSPSFPATVPTVAGLVAPERRIFC